MSQYNAEKVLQDLVNKFKGELESDRKEVELLIAKIDTASLYISQLENVLDKIKQERQRSYEAETFSTGSYSA